jgi:hypothetical protein
MTNGETMPPETADIVPTNTITEKIIIHPSINIGSPGTLNRGFAYCKPVAIEKPCAISHLQDV